MTKNMLLDPALTRQFFVGFDPLFEELEKKIIGNQDKYPPHDIIQVSEKDFQIVLAVAGFKKSDIEISLEKKHLKIKGSKSKEDVTYLYKGISNRAFTREFILQDDVQVASAKFEDGVLIINLERIVPEEDQPRLISLD